MKRKKYFHPACNNRGQHFFFDPNESIKWLAKHHYFKGMKNAQHNFSFASEAFFLLAYSILAMFSIGMLLLPGAIILLTGAVFKSRKERRKMPAI